MNDVTWTSVIFEEFELALQVQAWGNTRRPDPLVSQWHDPSEMQRSETSETPKNDMQKAKWSLTEGCKDRL